ncbi:MAG: hypothetical protein U1F87_18690 [Kiritimatiellia bacterium]
MIRSLIFLAALAPAATHATLIARYTFDSSAARYEDVSANAYDGSGVGTVSFAPGVSGDGMSVAGAGKMVYGAGAGIPVNLSDFTLSFWATDSSTSWDSWVEMNARAGGAEGGHPFAEHRRERRGGVQRRRRHPGGRLPGPAPCCTGRPWRRGASTTSPSPRPAERQGSTWAGSNAAARLGRWAPTSASSPSEVSSETPSAT